MSRCFSDDKHISMVVEKLYIIYQDGMLIDLGMYVMTQVLTTYVVACTTTYDTVRVYFYLRLDKEWNV